LMTRETVIADTPALIATSLIVTLIVLCFPLHSVVRVPSAAQPAHPRKASLDGQHNCKNALNARS
jgi:hypothetical protein